MLPPAPAPSLWPGTIGSLIPPLGAWDFASNNKSTVLPCGTISPEHSVRRLHFPISNRVILHCEATSLVSEQTRQKNVR